MKIEKFIKDSTNKYKLIIDGENYKLYDDVILKYQLIMKESITQKELDEVLDYNEKLTSYYDSIRYLNKKMRSEKEIREYLKKRMVSNENIDLTIEKLKSNNFINEEIYVKSYINDQINLTNNGPYKIIKNLINLGINENLINERLSTISDEVWNEKVDKYIDKKVRVNHKNSKNMLKMKITNELINLGYEKEMILNNLSNYDIIDKDIYKNEYEKAKKALEKKYSGYELDRKIKERLYRKGFNVLEHMGDTYED